jgi:hypothetical protein
LQKSSIPLGSSAQVFRLDDPIVVNFHPFSEGKKNKNNLIQISEHAVSPEYN